MSCRAAVLFAFFALPAFTAEPALVAPTDPHRRPTSGPRSSCPPGFEVQLVASEPDIQKPMQIAFDAKGRLWVTDVARLPVPGRGRQGDRQAVRPRRLRPGRARPARCRRSPTI